MLQKRHPLPSVDDAMGFDAPTHTYTCDGVPVPRSATAVVAALFPIFKPRKTVNTFFETWKASGKSKYQAVIATSFDDAEAKAAIVAGWANDTTARDRGTLVHKCVEDLLNGVAVDAEVRASVEPELGGFERFLEDSGWAPYRTELKVFAKDAAGGAPVLAGTIDALVKDADGALVMVDWKTGKPFGPREWCFRRRGHGPAARLDASKYLRYSVQLALYALMLKESTGLDVADRRALVRLPKKGGAELLWARADAAVDEAAAAALARLKAGEPVLQEGEGSSSDDAE